MATADIADVVAEFAADPRQASLELPHMTTGQRKAAKKLLENYPELRCESYGFGPERQLHLFKKCADHAEQEVQVKASEQKCDMSPLGPVRCLSSSTDGQETVLPAMDKELQVRNTFIHFDKSVDQRVVQSMPHGMFKQCLLAESSRGATGYETPTTMGCNTPTSVSEADLHELMCLPIEEEKRWSLCPGALVVVEGLVKAAAFNGRSAVVQSFDEESGRYSILLASSSGSQEAKIKEENLRVVLPCP